MIMDNDDWLCDNVTGEKQSINRTNMMFIQPEKWIMKSSETLLSSPRFAVKPNLKQITVEQQIIQPYRTTHRGEPCLYVQCDTSAPVLHGIREKMIAHTLG